MIYPFSTCPSTIILKITDLDDELELLEDELEDDLSFFLSLFFFLSFSFFSFFYFPLFFDGLAYSFYEKNYQTC